MPATGLLTSMGDHGDHIMIMRGGVAIISSVQRNGVAKFSN